MPSGVYDQAAIDRLRRVFDDILYQDQHNAAVRLGAIRTDPVALAHALLMTFDRGAREMTTLTAGTLGLLEREAVGAVRWLKPASAAQGILFVVDCTAVAGHSGPAPNVGAMA